jgi:phosphocarrier protein
MDAPGRAHRRVEIVNTHGLHMRPAGKFVTLAGSFRSEVWVDYQGARVNGKSVLDMTTLAAQRGTQMDIEAIGPDAEAAIHALAELVAAGFHMTEEDYRPRAEPR